MAQKLSPEARRLRTIIVTLPIIGATSFVLYKRLVKGEPQRQFPRNDVKDAGRLIELNPYKGQPGGREAQ